MHFLRWTHGRSIPGLFVCRQLVSSSRELLSRVHDRPKYLTYLLESIRIFNVFKWPGPAARTLAITFTFTSVMSPFYPNDMIMSRSIMSLQHWQTDNPLRKKCFERSLVSDQVSNLQYIFLSSILLKI